MVSDETLTGEKPARVLNGANGEPDAFVIDTGSAATADGETIVELTGATGWAISTRRSMIGYDGLIMDRRTFVAGTILAAAGGAFEAVSSGGHTANAAGQGFKVLRRGTEIYAASHFGVSPDKSDAANTTAIQDMLDNVEAGATVQFDKEGIYKFENGIDSATAGLKIRGHDGMSLRQENFAGWGITLSGAGVTLEDVNLTTTVSDVGDYRTNGALSTERAILRASGDDFTMRGGRIDRASRIGVLLSGKRARFLGVGGDAAYLRDDYDTIQETALHAIYYDPPVGGGVLEVAGCRFTRYLTPIGGGNLFDGGDYFLNIHDNYLWDCWDHAFYFLNVSGGHVHNNSMLDVRVPPAIDMNGVVYENNVHNYTGSTESNHASGGSFRRFRNGAVVRNNVWQGGTGGSLDFRDPSASVYTMSGEVCGNRVHPDGEDENLVTAMWFENTNGDIDGLLISDNSLKRPVSGAVARRAVRVAGRAGAVAKNVAIKGGTTQIDGRAFGIYMRHCDRPIIEAPHIIRTGSASSFAALSDIDIDDTFAPRITRPRHDCLSGGSNIALTAIKLGSNVRASVLIDPEYDLTSPNIAGPKTLEDDGSAGTVSGGEGALVIRSGNTTATITGDLFKASGTVTVFARDTGPAVTTTLADGSLQIVAGSAVGADTTYHWRLLD